MREHVPDDRLLRKRSNAKLNGRWLLLCAALVARHVMQLM